MKKILASILIITAFSYYVYANLNSVSSECLTYRANLESALNDANYCSTNTDCIPLYFSCPLPCSALINREENTQIRALEKEFLSRCMPLCEHECPIISPGNISCVEQRCVVN